MMPRHGCLPLDCWCLYRYTLLTFVPVFLFELFRNVAYFYFLIQVGRRRTR
jgi:hypothetical protein